MEDLAVTQFQRLGAKLRRPRKKAAGGGKVRMTKLRGGKTRGGKIS